MKAGLRPGFFFVDHFPHVRTPRSWEIFCRVVDNFGDAAVCWRLARQLAEEQAAAVRLWIDDLDSLARLVPHVLGVEQQTVSGVQVHRWSNDMPADMADVVVEAFGCGLPDAYVEAMACASPHPLWIVLEYLSAEPWVRDHHGLPSPHPRYPLERYFFFPGVIKGTGGLLREANLFAHRDAFDAAGRDAFWHSVGHATPPRDALAVSLFAYENAVLPDLLRCWENGARLTVTAIPESRVLPEVLDYFGVTRIPSERVLRRGALEVRVLPFLPQTRYDELLWSCDLNFVRGEDSFVRVQWAARPFVWQIYPQEERAHMRKLEAFLALYCEGMPDGAAQAVAGFTALWNQSASPQVSVAAAWNALVGERLELEHHARRWADRLALLGGLADNLAGFCRDKLK